MLLWVLFAVITLIATTCVVWPLLFGRAAAPGVADDERRLAVFRDRKREIEAERLAGRLNADEAERALTDLARQLSEEMPFVQSGAVATNDVAVAVAAPASPASAPPASASPDPSSPAAPRRATLAAALLVAIAIPLAALSVYRQLGTPQLADPQMQAALAADAAPIEALAAEIERRVQTHPDDGEAWAMLAEARKLQNRLDEAARAFEEARKRLPPNARLLTDYAETLALTSGGDFSGRPVELLEEALRLDADEPKAIALMGAAQYRLGNLERAHAYLKRLYEGLTPGSPEAQQIGEVLTRVATELAQRGGTPGASASAGPSASTSAGPAAPSAPASPGTQAPASAPAASATQVSGTIRIADSLAAQVPAGATLFIVARAVDGPRIPVAVARIGGATLPYSFTLVDQHAMDPARLLSSAGVLVIEARLSASSDATRRAGDLIGQATPVRPGDRAVTIVIDRVITP